MTTRFHTRAKGAAKAGRKTIDAAVPWLLLLFFLLLPLAVVLDRTVELGTTVVVFRMLIRLAKTR